MTIERIHAAAPIIERNGYDLIRATALAMTDANAIAKAIASTDMVPKHFRGKPDDLTAAILYGARSTSSTAKPPSTPGRWPRSYCPPATRSGPSRARTSP
jgi:hypothetical protein